MTTVAPPHVRAQRATLSDWVTLTKPRITLLLLVTASAAMVVAAAGSGLDGATVIATLVGLALTSGGASALNHVIDHDIDAKMERTADRPVVRGAISPMAGAIFGVSLLLAGTLLIGTLVNSLTAALAFGGGAFYVLGYTVILKRSTVQNIVIGGAAGATPPLVGWAAVTGTLDPLAWVMFGIVFLWTPPHFWALAILIRDDYERAGVPMLPVVKGVPRTATEILVYSIGLVVFTFVPLTMGDAGAIYALAAALLGGRLIALARVLHVVREDAEAVPVAARRMFLYSMSYLAGIFLALLIDQLV